LTNQKQELPVVAMFVNELGRNEQPSEDLPRKLPTKFGSFGQAVSEEKIFFKLANQKQESSVVAMFVTRSGRYAQYL
jgi:hypothetical protein